jgi:hypothetical protein
MLSLPSTKNLPYQQNIKTLPVSVIVLDARSNELNALAPLIPELESALSTLKPHSCVRIAQKS